MVEIQQTATFSRWLHSLRDGTTRARIANSVRRLAFGLTGYLKPVGEGITELRLHFGPGYRVYFVQRGQVLIVLLCGGDKSTQDQDIAVAKRLAKEVK